MIKLTIVISLLYMSNQIFFKLFLTTYLSLNQRNVITIKYNRATILVLPDSPSVTFIPTHSPFRVKLNTQVSITCNVDSYPSYNNLQWYKDNIPLSSKYGHSVEIINVLTEH